MKKVSISSLVPDPIQPRQEFDRSKLSLLENSIKLKGILNPLIVEDCEDGKYLIIDGERRYRASKNIGLKEVPVEIMTPMSVAERTMTRFHLQEQHENWSMFDRARAMSTFQEAAGLTNRQSAELLGMSVSAISMWTGILKLSKRSQAFVNNRRIPYSYTHSINRLASIYERFTDMPRTDVEMKLLEKYENKTLRSSDHFKALIRVGNEGDGKNLILFLNDPKMEVSDVLDKTIFGAEIELDVIAYRTRGLVVQLNRIKRKKNLTPFQKQIFNTAVNTFKKVLNEK